MDEVKTLFHKKAEDYQRTQDRTKKQGTKTELKVLGVSLAMTGGGVVFQLLINQIDVVFPLPMIMIVLGAIGIVIGIIGAIVSLMLPTKLVACPNCNTKHRIYKSVRKSMCPSPACHTLLLMGSNPRLTPCLSACPYCGLLTAVSDDHGLFLCPNCGIIRQPSGTYIGETKTCPGCKETLPKEAIYCKFCGTILKYDFDEPVELLPLEGPPRLAYDEDWKIGKDATGHFYFAEALLKSIRERTGEASDIAKVQVLLGKLADALISLEEALQESEFRSSVEGILPEIDLIYADLLDVELRSIQSETSFLKDELKVLTTEPHIVARERIEKILADSLESSGSIGKWNGKLVNVKQEKVYGRARLMTEVDRFTKWKAERGE